MCLAFSVGTCIYFHPPPSSNTYHRLMCHWWCSKLKVLEESVRNVTGVWGSPKAPVDSEINLF